MTSRRLPWFRRLPARRSVFIPTLVALTAVSGLASGARAEVYGPVDCAIYSKLIADPQDGAIQRGLFDPPAYALWVGKESASYQTRDGVFINFATTERRAFCVYDIEPVVGDIVRAELEFWVDRFISRDASERIVVYDVTTPIGTLRTGGNNLPHIWQDLGSGVSYGQKLLACDPPLPDARCSKNRKRSISVPVNAAAFHEMLKDGGTFAIGLAIDTLSFPATKCWRTDWDDGPTGKDVICHAEYLGSPTTTPTLTVVVKALQADARIRAGTRGAFIGNDVYSTVFWEQQVLAERAPGKTAVFEVSTQNDGNVRDRFEIEGDPAPNGYTVRYLDGATDVTQQVVDGTFVTPALDPGKAHRLTVRFKVKAATGAGLQNLVSVRATSRGDPTRSDLVTAYLRVVAPD